MAISVSRETLQEADSKGGHLIVLNLITKVTKYKKPLRGARVKATRGALIKSALTDADGIATLELPAAKYDITVSYNGKTVKTIKGFDLSNSNRRLNVDIGGLTMTSFGKIGAVTLGLLFIGGLISLRKKK